MRSLWWIIGWVGGASVGCGSVDTIPPRPSGEGGGAGGTTISSTTSSSSTGGSGACTVNAECPDGNWCGHAGCDGPGTCLPLPTGCPEDCPGVCGCDGVTYCNVCEAASAGVDVAFEEPCEADASYRAVGYAGGLDHLFLMKASPTYGRCSRIHASAPTTGSYAVTMPEPWAVAQVEVGELTADCLDESVPLEGGMSVEDAIGTIDWPGTPVIPCEVEVDLVIDLGDLTVPEPFHATLPVESCF